MTTPGADRAVPAVELFDGGDDGWDERAWVERTIDSDEAMKRLAVQNPDPDWYAIVLEGSEFLRPDDPAAPEADAPWHICAPADPGAREFWLFLAVDKADVDA